jgi:hypothetical protein
MEAAVTSAGVEDERLADVWEDARSRAVDFAGRRSGVMPLIVG